MEKAKAFINWIMGTMFMALVLISLFAFLFWIFSPDSPDEIQFKKNQMKEIENTIDSLKTNRSDTIHSVSIKSRDNAKKSTKLIKTLPDEKTLVPDATYDTMCRYITEYHATN